MMAMAPLMLAFGVLALGFSIDDNWRTWSIGLLTVLGWVWLCFLLEFSAHKLISPIRQPTGDHEPLARATVALAPALGAAIAGGILALWSGQRRVPPRKSGQPFGLTGPFLFVAAWVASIAVYWAAVHRSIASDFMHASWITGICGLAVAVWMSARCWLAAGSQLSPRMLAVVHAGLIAAGLLWGAGALYGLWHTELIAWSTVPPASPALDVITRIAALSAIWAVVALALYFTAARSVLLAAAALAAFTVYLHIRHGFARLPIRFGGPDLGEEIVIVGFVGIIIAHVISLWAAWSDVAKGKTASGP
jgi:hypothetical protein